MELTKPIEAAAGMLIRRPVREVFEAFIDPAVTSNFWFSSGTARLEVGKPVTWTWATYNVSSTALATEIVPDEKLVIDWDPGTDHASTVEWRFAARGDGATFVTIRNFNFKGDGDAQVQQAIGSTDGFAIVLCGLKAWLEHGLRLGGINDRWPDGLG